MMYLTEYSRAQEHSRADFRALEPRQRNRSLPNLEIPTALGPPGAPMKAHAIHELSLAWIDHDDELIKCSLELQMSVAR